jgi:hypothetical protein
MQEIMINNTISQAKNKLAKHRELGKNSSLSIMEVAKLMDLVKFGPLTGSSNKAPLFFNQIWN